MTTPKPSMLSYYLMHFEKAQKKEKCKTSLRATSGFNVTKNSFFVSKLINKCLPLQFKMLSS